VHEWEYPTIDRQSGKLTFLFLNEQADGPVPAFSNLQNLHAFTE
jgi:hypothetical protein